MSACQITLLLAQYRSSLKGCDWGSLSLLPPVWSALSALRGHFPVLCRWLLILEIVFLTSPLQPNEVNRRLPFEMPLNSLSVSEAEVDI